jgi:cyclic peptide transporter
MLRFFKGRVRRFLFFIVALGIINSLLFSAILVIVNNVITGVPLPFFKGKEEYVFSFVLVSSLLLNKIFQTNIVRLTRNIIFREETELLSRLRDADYQSFEKIGKERIYTAFNDTNTLGMIPELVVNAVSDMVTILCCLVYICSMAPVQGLVIVLLIGLLFVFYFFRNIRIERDLNRLRDYHNHFYGHLNAMLQGFKQLKVGAIKREAVFNRHLIKNRNDARQLAANAAIRYVNNELTGRYSWYVVLGVILFVLPALGWLEKQQLVAFVISVLYMIGPLGGLLLLTPLFTNIKIAQRRMNALYEEVKQMSVVANSAAYPVPETAFEKIAFNNVVFHYSTVELTDGFETGPFDIVFHKEEVVFITGRNGSGKTSFINLLTGLYKPNGGAICYNGEKVDDLLMTPFIRQTAIIFSDNYLFEENYEGLDLHPTNERLNYYINLLQMEAAIQFDEPGNRIRNKLSAGQKKRLALIYALLENKSVLILDEWAAEQDSAFKDYFYCRLIPMLKKEGKTIIAVTHDEDYYHVADRVLKFDCGRIVDTADIHNNVAGK